MACTRVACLSIHGADLSPHNILVALGFVRQAEAACKAQAKCLWRVQQWGLSIMYSLLWRWDEVVAHWKCCTLMKTETFKCCLDPK